MFPVRSSNENEVTSAVQDRMPPTRGALAETEAYRDRDAFCDVTDQSTSEQSDGHSQTAENAARTIRSSDLRKPLNPLKINNLRSQRELHR
jgi:hypothetical protein